MLSRPWFALFACAAISVVVGCGESIEVGTVSGTVTDEKGKPLDSVRVYFMPDLQKATEGRASWAITDQQGRYELEYQGGDGGPGAALGWHKVTLQDIAGENFRGNGPPPKVRVPAVYMDPSASPISIEVVPGEQTVDLEVKPLKTSKR